MNPNSIPGAILRAVCGFTRAGASARETTPGNGNTCEREPRPNLELQPRTKPPLSRLGAILLFPLTRAGRKNLPLYYLVRPPTRIGRAPRTAPLSEKMRRRAEAAAIVLWWPIGKVLTLFWLWRQPPSDEAVLAWWQSSKAAQDNHKLALPATSTEERSVRPDQGRPLSSQLADQGSWGVVSPNPTSGALAAANAKEAR